MEDKISIIYREAYPPTLKNISSSPKKLYVRGHFPAPEGQKYLCVIGSRSFTTYGRDCVRRLILGLAGYPVTIVSGLAIGIDSIAHMAALEAGLHCVGFPGSTLDWAAIYPTSHADLARRIVRSGGALLSPWAVGYETGNWAFPARNRLMAGLAHATLIIEAGRRSGSLMTAKHAEDFDRDVYAVPGHVHAPQSYGTHMLIQRGAALITSSRDILVELGFKPPRTRTNGNVPIVPASVKEDGLAMRILKIVSLEEASVNDLIDSTGASAQDMNIRLSLLELEGLIQIVGPTVSLFVE